MVCERWGGVPYLVLCAAPQTWCLANPLPQAVSVRVKCLLHIKLLLVVIWGLDWGRLSQIFQGLQRPENRPPTP